MTPLFESDSQPVDGAEITINGNPVTETSLGSFQTAITTWSPMYELTVGVERLGFQSQIVTLSGYALGNLVVEAISVIVVAVLILRIKRRRTKA